jgi:hypothetical protein
MKQASLVIRALFSQTICKLLSMLALCVSTCLLEKNHVLVQHAVADLGGGGKLPDDMQNIGVTNHIAKKIRICST